MSLPGKLQLGLILPEMFSERLKKSPSIYVHTLQNFSEMQCTVGIGAIFQSSRVWDTAGACNVPGDYGIAKALERFLLEISEKERARKLTETLVTWKDFIFLF